MPFEAWGCVWAARWLTGDWVGGGYCEQGANYRLIDIPVSNCINSNVNKIYCLTQFNSASLNRHLSMAYVRAPSPASPSPPQTLPSSGGPCGCCKGACSYVQEHCTTVPAYSSKSKGTDGHRSL